jgi:uncharacterized membrane protein
MFACFNVIIAFLWSSLLFVVASPATEVRSIFGRVMSSTTLSPSLAGTYTNAIGALAWLGVLFLVVAIVALIASFKGRNESVRQQTMYAKLSSN